MWLYMTASDQDHLMHLSTMPLCHRFLILTDHTLLHPQQPAMSSVRNPLLLSEVLILIANHFNHKEAISPSLVCRTWCELFSANY